VGFEGIVRRDFCGGRGVKAVEGVETSLTEVVSRYEAF